jgi:diketogulonate reductase-like aldo/keto reductase
MVTPILTYSRWRHGSSRPYKTSQRRTAGTSSSPCRTTTISFTAKKSAKWYVPATPPVASPTNFPTDVPTQIPYCQDTGVGLIPWSPIARGALTRPWSDRSSKRSTTDKFVTSLVYSRENDIDKKIIERVEEVSKKHNVSMATIATAWCIKKGVMPIIGLSSKERIEQAVENIHFNLSDEDAKYLEEAYMPKERQGY